MINKKKKNILIGLGGFGCKVASICSNNLSSICIDTCEKSLEKNYDNYICLSDNFSLESVFNSLNKEVKEYFNYDSYKDYDFTSLKQNGTNFQRNVGFLLLYDYLNNSDKKNHLNDVFDSVFYSKANIQKIYVVTSLVGGTGSSIFLALSLYLRKYIKVKYNLDIKISLLAITSDALYKDKISDEKIKANIYSSLRELNTVHQVTTTKISKKEQADLPFIIKIGDNELFDSTNSLFQKEETFPFSSVYLIDNTSNKEHIVNKVVELIDSINNEIIKPSEKNLYTSIYTYKIAYPTNKIIKYISSRKVYDEIKTQWIAYTDYIEHQVKAEREDVLYSTKEDRVNTFISVLISKLEKKVEDNPKSFLDDFMLFRKSSKYNTLEVVNHSINTSNYIYERILNYKVLIDIKEIRDLVEESEKIENIHFFDSKEVKTRKRKNLTKRINYYNDVILDFYKYIKENYYNKLNEIYNKDLSEHINSYFTDEQGKYVIPSIALLKLCLGLKMLRKYKNKFESENKKYFEQITNDNILNGVLKCDDDLLEKTNNLNNIDINMRKNTIIIVNSMINYFSYQMLEKVVDYLFVKISIYRNMFNSLNSLLVQLSSTVKSVMSKSEDDMTNEIELNGLEESFYRLFNKNYTSFDDDTTGKVVFSFVDKEEDYSLENIKQLFNQLTDLVYQKIKDTKEIEICKISVLESLLRKDITSDLEKNNQKLDKIIKALEDPVALRSYETIENKMIISKKTSFEKENLEYIDKQFNILFNENVLDDEMILQREISFPLSFYKKIAENGECFVSYMNTKTLTSVDIFNSSIFKENSSIGFTNPINQNDYLLDVVKALIYILSFNKLDVKIEKNTKKERTGKYFLEKSIVCGEEGYIIKDDLKSIIFKLIASEKDVLTFSKLFDEEYESLRSISKEDQIKKLLSNKLFKCIFGDNIKNTKTRNEVLSNNLLISLYFNRRKCFVTSIIKDKIILLIKSLSNFYEFDSKTEKEKYEEDLIKKVVKNGLGQFDKPTLKEKQAYQNFIIK